MTNLIKPYTEWEDWKAGMYRDIDQREMIVMIQKAKSILANKDVLQTAMRAVTLEWTNASHANLREPPNNRSWLGQAACCYCGSAPESATRQAWGLLTDCERAAANKIADMVIEEWKRTHNKSGQLELNFNV